MWQVSILAKKNDNDKMQVQIKDFSVLKLSNSS